MDTHLLPRLLPVRHRGGPCCTVCEELSLTQEQTATLADLLKALGDSTRLRMLDLLAQQSEPLCVCDITPRFNQNQPTISHHLKLLREEGLIDTAKQGIWAYYWATEKGRRALATIKNLT